MLKDIFPQNAIDLELFSKNSIMYKFFFVERRKDYTLFLII